MPVWPAISQLFSSPAQLHDALRMVEYNALSPISLGEGQHHPPSTQTSWPGSRVCGKARRDPPSTPRQRHRRAVRLSSLRVFSPLFLSWSVSRYARKALAPSARVSAIDRHSCDTQHRPLLCYLDRNSPGRHAKGIRRPKHYGLTPRRHNFVAIW